MVRAVLLSLFLCLGGVVAPPAHAQGAATTPSEEKAIQAFRQGSFSKAVELYRQALQETDDATHRARLHVNIAWTLYALGRESEVRTHLSAALVEDPNLTLLPDYYTQEFIDLFDRARLRGIETDPTMPLPDLESTIAGIQARLDEGKDLEAALADLDRLFEVYPEDGRLIPLLAEVLRGLDRDQEAEDLLRTYTGTTTGLYAERMSIPDLILRANRLLEDGDSRTSLELLREAVARQPNNVAALELMAEAAQRSGRWDEAEFALKSALGMQPDNVGLQLRLGEVYIAENQLSAARDVFRTITERSPHSARGWAALGLLEARLGNGDRALSHLDRAINENPLLPEVQLARGELLLAGGQPTAALAALEAAENLLHDDPQLEARLGQALLALGQSSEALVQLRAAVDGGFDRDDVRRSLALALALEGRLAEAERVLAEAGFAANHDQDLVRAVVMLERGSYAAAEEILRTVVEKRPNEPAVLNLFASALYSQHRYAETVELLKRAEELDPDNIVVAENLAVARAALAAERLALNATAVKAAPSK